MEEFDLYGDLELLHAEEKQNAIEDLKWKDKYNVALITIEKLQAENKDLKKKIKHLEINFASLFDTARTEIKRKDNLISELRKQKDDVCFRRSKPQFSAKQFDDNSDVRRAASSESVHVNPFSRQPRKANTPNSEASKPFLDEKLPSIYENGKRKHEAPRDVTHETDESRGRRRDRTDDDRVENQDRRRDRSKEERDERRERRRDRSQDDRVESQDRRRDRSNDDIDENLDRRKNRSKDDKDESRERHRDRSNDDIDEGRDRHKNRSKNDKDESRERHRDRSNDDIDGGRDRHKHRSKDDKDESRERHKDSYRLKNEKYESQDRRRNRSKDDKDESREKRTDPSKDCRDESHERQRNSYRPKDEQDESQDRRKNRSKDRSRHRNRSRDRVDEERSRQRCDDRYDIKNRDRLEDSRSNKSKERSDRKKEKKSDKKRKRHERDVSQTRSSDSSWDKHAKMHCHSLQMNYTNDEKTKVSSNKFEPTKHEEKPKDSFKSNISDPPKDKTNDSKTDMNQLKNVVPCPNDSEKQRENSKIEILQIEILKDVKEFKKNKLKTEKIPKPDPVNPAAVAIEKSNQFLEALFDDTIMNKPEDPNNDNDLYDDLLTSNHQPPDSIPESTKKENHLLLKNENCNLNYHTPPQRKSNAKLLDDLFGPSPAGSLCPAVSSQNSEKSVSASSSDSDFILIPKPVENSQKDEMPQLTTLPKVPLVEQIVIHDSCNQNDEKINKECSEMKPPTKPASVGLKQSDSDNETKKFSKIDENCNFKQQTPQKQLSSNLMDDLFGPSPGSSIRAQKTSVTSMDESSSDSYFEPTVSRVEPRKSPSKIPIDGSSSVNVQTYNEKIQAIETDEAVVPCSSENMTKGNIPNNNTKTFKFVELDSSFYSSEDEINVDSMVENCKSSRVEVESPPLQNITPFKNIERLENVSSEEESNVLSKPDENLSQLNCVKSTTEKETTIAKCKDEVMNKTKRDNFEKASYSEREKDSKTCHYSSERNKESDTLCKKDDSKEDYFSSKHRSDKSRHRSRTEKERRRHRHEHHAHHHHHHRKNKEHSKESSHTKSHSSSYNGDSRKHDKNYRDRNERENRDKFDLISSKNEVPKSISSPLLLYYDDDSAKDSLQNQKTADSDQVFFLHCDDISSDEDSIGNESYSGNDKNKQNIAKEKITAEKELKRNMIEIEKPPIINEFESNKDVADTFESNDKEINSNISSKHENSKEKECNVLTLEPETQNKDLALENVKETSSSTIEENPSACEFVDTSICDIKLKSNKITIITNNGATHYSEDVCHVDNDQQFSEHHENIQKYSVKENDDIEIQNTENAQTKVDNSDESKEQEKSENHIDDQVTHKNSLNIDEKMSLDEGSSGAENVCSVEMEPEHESIHTNEDKSELPNSIRPLEPTSHHDKINNSPNVPDTKQSKIEENDKHSPLDDDKIEKDLNSNGNGEASGSNFENSTPDEEFRTCIAERVSIEEVSGNNFENVTPHEELKTCIAERVSIENSSDIQLLAIDSDKPAQVATLQIDDTQSETNSHEINSLNPNQSSETSLKKTDVNKEEHVSNPPAEQISETTTTNDPGSNSNSSEFPSLHVSPLKLHNSADELESLHSNSSLVSSGRRRKIKTPRKRTDVCLYKNDSNRIMTMISDRYATSNEVSCSVESDSSLLSVEGTFKSHSPSKDTGSLKQNEISTIEDSKGTLVVKEIVTDKIQQGDQKPEFSSKEILYDSNNQNKCLPSLSATEEPKPDEIPLNLCSNTNDEKMDEHGLSTSFSSSTVKEILVKNSEEVCRKSEKTENVHTKSSAFIDAEKESPLETGLYQEEKNKEDQANENILESHSITIKRNRSKKKVFTNPTEIVESLETSEDLNVKNNTPYSELIRQNETKNIKVGFNENVNCDYLKETHKVRDNFCTSSAILASSHSISTLIQQHHQQNAQHQMMKHFMDSEHSFVGTCDYPAGLYCDEVLEIKPIEKTAKRGRPRKNPSVDNIDSELKKKSTESSSASETTKVTVKRKYTKKAKKSLDTSSKSNEKVFNSSNSEELEILSNDVDNNQNSSKTMEHHGSCNYPSATNSGEIVETELNDTNVKKKRRKSITTTLENSETMCDAVTSQVKRKYNKKNRQILDSSNSNEDLEATSCNISQETKTVPSDEDENEKKQKTTGDMRSIESKEPAKKRKYKKTNLNSSSDSNKSNELTENPSFLSPLGSTIHSEKVLDQIHILPPTDERVDAIPPPCNETTDLRLEKSSTTFSDEKELNQTIGCSMNSSVSGEEKDHNSCINTNKKTKTKKQRKRKLSQSSDTKSEELIVEAKRPKNSPTNTSRPAIETSCPVSVESVQPESIKQQHQRSPRCSENLVSIALTPTHHKIFLNDVFPNDPPPVYKANDDDLQYHEIDDRLRSMFQSPSYTPSSNVELPIEKGNDDVDKNVTCEGNLTIEETLNESENILVDETLNQSETTKCDISAGSRKVLLGSNEYVIESIGSHTSNVFITRKKSKKRTKSVAATSVV